MRRLTVHEFIAELGVELPPADEFWRLADATGLRREPAGSFYRSNYERGLLLYALVIARRPANLLEIGTGRGYGALVMARALTDAGLDGRIHSVDRLRGDEPMDWPIDWHDGAGPRVERLCRNEVYSRLGADEWLARIEFHHGTAAQLLPRWSGPRIDFAFIDGDHSYAGVRHDFLSLTQLAADRLGVLFDDYDGKEEFGVDRLVDQTVAPHFDCTVITNDGRASGGEGHAMAFAAGEGAAGWLAAAYPAAEVAATVRAYRAADARRRLTAPLRRAWRRLHRR